MVKAYDAIQQFKMTNLSRLLLTDSRHGGDLIFIKDCKSVYGKIQKARKQSKHVVFRKKKG